MQTEEMIKELDKIKRELAEVWEHPPFAFAHNLREPDALYGEIYKQVGSSDPRAIAFAALNLAMWAIRRIEPR